MCRHRQGKPVRARYRERHDRRRRQLHRPRRAGHRSTPHPPGRDDRQGLGGPDGQQRLPDHVFPRPARRCSSTPPTTPPILLELIERARAEAVADRHQPPALGPLAGAGGRGEGDRRADRRASTRRRAAAGEAGSDPRPRRHRRDRRADLRRHPSAGPHPRARWRWRCDGADEATPPVHRRLPVPRRRRQDVGGRRRSTSCSAT